MQRPDSYRVHLSGLAVAIAACSPAPQAYASEGTAVPVDPVVPTSSDALPTTPSGVQTLDAMQVTGVRRANAAAVESKRAATNITDVISATDVRALPDSTIVEALRRVPGLSVLPATDNEHPRDEAATPVLRGLGPSGRQLRSRMSACRSCSVPGR